MIRSLIAIVIAALLVNTVAAQAAAAGAVATASSYNQYGTAYNLQTGTILYASMPPLPPTSISKTNTDPLYATSAATIATTFLGAGTISTTVTQAATYSFDSHANTVRRGRHRGSYIDTKH